KSGTGMSNGSISVNNDWHEANGNAGTSGSTGSFVVDTVTPTVTVLIDHSDVNLANNTAMVMFTFSEAPIDFSLANVTANGGTLSNFSGSGTIYTVTFTAKNGIDISNGSVSVDNNWHEGNGNAGTNGSTGRLESEPLKPTPPPIIDPRVCHQDKNT